MASVMTISSGFWEVLVVVLLVFEVYFYHHGGRDDLGKVVERGSGCIHLLERRLARGDVGEDVGETLGGHCEGYVWVVLWSVVECEMSIGESRWYN